MSALILLALIFGEISLLAFGGINAVVPEMQRQIVEGAHWMTAQQFSALFALAQAAPGPNIMIVPLVGWRVAGGLGAATAFLANLAPSSLLTALALSLWDRFKERPWRRRVQAALAPITIGLVAASAALISEAAAQGPFLAALAGAGALLSARAHPLLVLGLGALVGLSGIGQS